MYGSYTDLQAYEERLRVLTTFSRQTRSTDTPAPLGTPIIVLSRVNKSAGTPLTLDDVPGKAGQVFDVDSGASMEADKAMKPDVKCDLDQHCQGPRRRHHR